MMATENLFVHIYMEHTYRTGRDVEVTSRKWEPIRHLGNSYTETTETCSFQGDVPVCCPDTRAKVPVVSGERSCPPLIVISFVDSKFYLQRRCRPNFESELSGRTCNLPGCVPIGSCGVQSTVGDINANGTSSCLAGLRKQPSQSTCYYVLKTLIIAQILDLQ